MTLTFKRGEWVGVSYKSYNLCNRLRETQGDRCHWCGRLLEFSSEWKDHNVYEPIPGRGADEAQFRATVDHLISHNLTYIDPKYCVISCQPCNSYRENQLEKMGKKWLRHLADLDRRLFHSDLRIAYERAVSA